VDGLTAALTVGVVHADVVAVEARRIAQARPPFDACVEPANDPARVVSLTERRLLDPAAVIAGLPADERPLPTVTAYDELLARRPADDRANLSTAATKGEVS